MNIKEIVDFIKECDYFVVVTQNGSFPSARPFGAIFSTNDKLYLSTNNTKKVYNQILKNNHIHIMALKPKTRIWIRFNAVAIPCNDLDIKQQMFESNKRLQEIY